MSNSGPAARALHDALKALQTGDMATAQPAALAALEAFSTEGDRTGSAAAHQVLAITALSRGRPDEALTHVDAAIPLRESTGDIEGLASLWQERLELCLRMGDLEGARHSAEQQVETWRKSGEREGLAHAIHQLGQLVLQLGDDGRAEALVQEALFLLDPTTQARARCALLLLYSSIALQRQDLPRAFGLAREGLEMGRAAKNRQAEVDALQQCGVVHSAMGEHAAARRALEEALVGRELLKDGEGKANVLQELATVEVAMGEFDSALDRLGYAARTLRDAGNVIGEVTVLQLICEVAENNGRPEGALVAARELVEAAARTGDREAEAGAHFMLASRFAGVGDLPNAAKEFRIANEIQEILALPHEAAVSQGMLGQVLVAMGDTVGGRAALSASLIRLEALNSEAAETVRDVLAELTATEAEG